MASLIKSIFNQAYSSNNIRIIKDNLTDFLKNPSHF